MGIFDFLEKHDLEEELDKDIEKIFEKMLNVQQARATVDKAISYRNLNIYDKAINLLEDTIKKYPLYYPAKTILGTTLMMKGDIEAAERHFKKILTEHGNGEGFPLIEVYANLGLLYHNYKRDNQTALKYYELALNAKKPNSIEEDKYKGIMVSKIYRDLILLHSKEEKWELVKKYALLRLEILKDCPIATVAYGFCLINEYADVVYNYSRNPLESEDKSELLLDAINYFNIPLSNNPNYYIAFAGIAIASFHLRILYSLYAQFPDKAFSKFGITKETIYSVIKSLKETESRILSNLLEFGKESRYAKSCFEFYQSQVSQVESFLGLKK